MPPLVILGVLLVQTLPILVLGIVPFRDQFGLRPARIALLLAVVFALDLAQEATVYLVDISPPMRIVVALLGQLAIAFAVARIARQPLLQQVFIIFVIKNYTDNVRMAAGSVAGFFFQRNVWVEFGLQMFSLCLTLVPLLLALRRYLRLILDQHPGRDFWRNLCIIPIGNFLLLRFAVSPDYLWQGMVWSGTALGLAIFWPLSTFFAYFAVLRMCALSVQNRLSLRHLRDAELAVSLQTKQTALAQKRAQQLSLEHRQLDQWLEQMQSLLRGGDTAGAKQMLENRLGRLEGLAAQRLCENAVADSVVRQYIQWAEAADIQMQVRLHLPAALPVPEVDVFAVLSNLLENALEACLRQRRSGQFIRCNCAPAGVCGLMISVRNSCDAPPVIRDGVYLSAKRATGPGLGIVSIRAVAEKYEGIVRLEHRDGVFEASVLLNGPGAGVNRGDDA